MNNVTNIITFCEEFNSGKTTQSYYDYKYFPEDCQGEETLIFDEFTITNNLKKLKDSEHITTRIFEISKNN